MVVNRTLACYLSVVKIVKNNSRKMPFLGGHSHGGGWVALHGWQEESSWKSLVWLNEETDYAQYTDAILFIISVDINFFVYANFPYYYRISPY